ncbi:MAG: chromosomal replication initiator protein DnaA [Hyphomicrobiales bacterium]|nr:MAG: chromosomal replication initiator protein DnaA [Hyphomicrobiales bacterium]
MTDKSGSDGKNSWDKVRRRLRAELGEEVFSSWFARVDVEACDKGSVHLSVPTRFLKQWIQSHYRDRLIDLWQQEHPEVRRVELSVRGALRPRPANVNSPTQNANADKAAPAAAPAGRASPAAPAAQPSATGRESGLNGSPLDPRLTFDNFVEGMSNNLALAAAKQVAASHNNGPLAFNPLFLHASVGLGKTHLLQAIAWSALQGAPERRVLYLTAEQFVYRFVASLRDQSAIDFKEMLRGIDLLLIDDMQFLQGRHVQQEFCHTLNALIDGARQVVVAADRAPFELEAVDERVRSRLGGGLLIQINAPDFQTRRAILDQRIALARRSAPDFTVPDEVLDYVARHVTANARDLDGAVNRMIAHNQLTGAAVSMEMAEAALRDLTRARESRRVRIEDIQRVVSKHYNVSRSDLVSERRTRTIVRPRQVAMYLAKTMTPRSLPEIGRHFGGRDHTTVLHAVRKIEELCRNDTGLAQEIDLIRRLLDL